MFFETEDDKTLKFVSSIYDVGISTVSFKPIKDDFTIETERSNNLCKTIYYSPHFDFKYNPNFDEVDNFDISFDQILNEDLADLQNKNLDQSGFNFSASEELVFKNSIRQILFSNSDLVKKKKFLKTYSIFQNMERQGLP